MNLAERLRVGLADPAKGALIAHDGPLVDHSAETAAAAVLIAVTDRVEPGVILTMRPKTMRKHPGQVAFPGGRMDESDSDIVAAALREAEEEIALPAHLVTIIGPLDDYRTVTDYTITPIMAVIPPDLALRANPHEVAAIFEVPLSFLLDPANHTLQDVEWQGQMRQYWEMHWGGHRIWGATAAMIVNLSRRLIWPL